MSSKTKSKSKVAPLRKELPNIIIPILNKDKSKHEKWTEGRNMLNLPSPSRVLLAGPPSTGKTTCMKNIIVRANPPYKKIIVVHCAPEQTREYDDIECQILNAIPKVEDFHALIGDNKALVILEDIEYNQMKKDQKQNLDRLFGYVSTHLGEGKGVSVFCTSQDIYSLPTCVRRMTNFWILWRMKDLDSMKSIARKCGIDSKKFVDEMLKLQGRESLWIDDIPNTPYKVRKNGFDLLNLEYTNT